MTSEGVFVFTSSAPSADAMVGNRVQVQGTVQEYVPSADPAQPPSTEIVTPTVILASNSNALPAPFELTTAFPDPNGAYDQLERLEGMRVTAAGLTVNAPTQGNVNEANATATSIGVFHAVVTGLPRAYRTAGVQQPDPLPAGSPAGVPRWNTSPQVIAVNSGALGGDVLDLASGCVITGGTTGVLDYTYRRYTLYPESTLQYDCGDALQPKPALQAGADDVAIATYNMERFFDADNDPAVGEAVLTPAAYQGRLNKASLAIRDYLNTPDIVATEEIESLPVLQAIAAKISSDAIAAGQPDPHYVAYLQEGNDVGGIDVGFLAKNAEVAAGMPRVEVIAVTQEGKATSWTEPGGGSSLLNDRPPLVLQAVVHFADGRSFPVTAIAVHQRSLNGAETDDASGERIRAKRQKQADFLADLIQQRQLADPGERIMVMGDFNAFEFNDGYVDAMGTVTGLPSADDTTVVTGDGADRVDPDLYDLTLLNPPDVSYSYAFDGNIQSLDHILANAALMDAGDLATLTVSHARIDADFPETARNDTAVPTRLSDHDPTLVLLKLKASQSADIGVDASATPASVAPGDTAHFSVDVGNAGPDAAAFAAVAFVFDQVVAPVVTPPTGWVCGPATTAAPVTATCTIDSFTAGATQAFQLAVPTTSAQAGTTLTMAASATSQTADGNAGNDNDTASVDIVAPAAADLALSITGPATLPASTFSTSYTLTLANNGSVAAAQPTLVIDGNTMTSTATITAPAGWRCSKQTNGSPRSATLLCSGPATLAAQASVGFALKVNARPAPVGGVITVEGTASSPTPDANPADNHASIATVLQ
jgi:hypothetical protein